jgi:hypothetical protein
MCRDYPDNGDGSNSHIYGYRLIVQREGKRVRLFSRNGYDWSHSFPLIVEAALRNRQSSFVIDGEAVLLGVDGDRISTACTRVSMTKKFSSTPSTCWSAMGHPADG